MNIPTPISRASLIALVCILIGGAACGDAGGSDSSPPNSAAESSEDEPTPNEIIIKGVAFVPADLEVAVGTEVTWMNEDAVDHTVTSGSQREQGVPGVEKDKPARPDGMFDSDLPEKGDTFGFTFDEPGTYSYYCDVHSGMTGEITAE